MFGRFTDRARRIVVHAQDEARSHNHNHIGTEHFLLGIAREGAGVAVVTLQRCGVTLDEIRADVDEIIGYGAEPASGHVPFTPRAKKVLELSLRESLLLGHSYIGSEHLLLGLLREGEGVAAQVLRARGLTHTQVSHQVERVLDGDEPDTDSGQAGASETAGPSEAAEPGGDDWDGLVARLESIRTRLVQIEKRLLAERPQAS